MFPLLFSAAHASQMDTVSTSTSSTIKDRRWQRVLYPLGDEGHQGERKLFEWVLESVDGDDDEEQRISNEASSRGYAFIVTDKNIPRSASHPPATTTHSTFVAMPAVKTYTWISLWFAITIPVIFWDAFYCFLRPRSMKGGDLHWIWSPYAIYQNVDLVYGVQTYLDKGGFTNAQSLLNIIENLLNITYLYLAHVSASPTATLIGFTSAVMTLSKTVLYWLQEFYCGYCAVGHNTLKDLIVYWIIPNGLWIVIPAGIVYTFGKDIVQDLRLAATARAGNSKAVKNE